MDLSLRRGYLGRPALDDLDVVVERYQRAVADFVNGDPEPYKAMFSNQEDVSLANPFGPVTRGWEQVAATMERAASQYRDGEITGFENVATYETPDLAYIVEIERFKAEIDGREELAPVALRTTSVLRPEDGTWKVVHRHADPITMVQLAESVIAAQG
jgi:ketosteroid isomerase-like protein